MHERAISFDLGITDFSKQTQMQKNKQYGLIHSTCFLFSIFPPRVWETTFPLMRPKNSGFFCEGTTLMTPTELRITTKVLKDLYVVTVNRSADSAVFHSVGTEQKP